MKKLLNLGGVNSTYLSPEIDICEIPADRGFGGSGSIESFEDGGTLSWDNKE